MGLNCVNGWHSTIANCLVGIPSEISVTYLLIQLLTLLQILQITYLLNFLLKMISQSVLAYDVWGESVEQVPLSNNLAFIITETITALFFKKFIPFPWKLQND